MRNRTTFKDLKVILDDAELLEISRNITNIVLEIEDIEKQKTRVKGMREDETYYSKIFKQGYDVKSVRCSVLFNSPTTGTKTIIRDDTDEQVEQLEMTKDEMQEDFNFEEQADPSLELKENEDE